MTREDPLHLVGTTIFEKYRVESVVGEGAFAIVYRATHLIWNRPVAIKAFRALGSTSSERRDKLLEGFIREGALLAELSESSAAIVQARDIATLILPDGNAMPCMVLEWLDGAALDAVLDDERKRRVEPRTVAEAFNLLEPVAEALSLAHAKGITHRDVKPANIFILGDPRSDSFGVKLLDFGIATVVDAERVGSALADTLGAVASFTPAFAAPEQFSPGHGPTGPWTDVFALALIFTELVTGSPPLDGDTLPQLEFTSSDPKRRPTPRRFGVTIPDAVEAVLLRAVAVSAPERWSSCSDFWSALRLALSMPPTRTTRTRSRPIAPQAALPERGGARVNRIAVGAVVGFVAICGASAYFLGRGGAPGPKAANVTAALSTPSVVPSAPPTRPVPTCPAGMARVPGGKFFMGSDDKIGIELERPAHQVILGAYCIDVFEVTTADYKACSDTGSCKHAGRENEWDGITPQDKRAFDPLCNIRDPDRLGKHPINCVDWNMAAAFCANEKKRLPTEAEWEFAARGSDGRLYPWGDEPPSAAHLNACGKECVAWGKKNRVDEFAMYNADDGWANTAPVGSFPEGRSPFGLHDVVGNVWEWTADWFAPYTAAAAEEPKGPDQGDARVIRGGAWNGAQPSWVRPTFRYRDAPDKRSYGVGFRCAKGM